MKNSKLLKTLLIPSLGTLSIGAVAIVSTSCAQEIVPVSGVNLDKHENNIGLSHTSKLVATVLPETATDKSVTWFSSDESIATVDANGKVTAIAEGTATITVASIDNPSAKDACLVKVTNQYVTILAVNDSTLELSNSNNNPDLSYSYDGVQWNTYSNKLNISADQTLYLRGNNPEGFSNNDGYTSIIIEGYALIGSGLGYDYGSCNVMSLLDNGTMTITEIPNDYCFQRLFKGSTGIVGFNANFLPATTLTIGCYDSMFEGCTLLTTAPELPAITLADDCYCDMFAGCSSLQESPELPATSLAKGCYSYMFFRSGIQEAPNLPATTLADNCYDSMFYGCRSLTNAPELPATTLAPNCYIDMFCSCSLIETAPELPATNLVERCYYGMFKDCSSINAIKIRYIGNYISNYFNEWIKNISESGTFYYKGTDSLANFGFPRTNWHIDSEWD